MRKVSGSTAYRWLSLFISGFLSVLAIVPATAGMPAGAPSELKVAFVDFFSGPAATFGVPDKNTAVWLVDKWNQEGGLRGVKVKLLIVDEAGTPDAQVVQFRRLALDEKVNAVVGYTSSANCLAVAPAAEELKVLTVIHVCGTRRLTEDNRLTYVFRTSDHQAADSVMGARYLLAMDPTVKTIAGANEDYAWGRDSWTDFKDAILQLKPDVKVVAELWTKIQAGEYSGEISKLLAANPEAIHSSFWGGGLITFVEQAAPRGVFKDHLVYLSTGEQALQDLKRDMPEGVVVGPRATDGYFLYPDPQTRSLQSSFVHGLKTRFGRFPDYPSHRTYQALEGLRAAYEKAMDHNGGRWPSTEEVIKAFVGLTWQTPYGPVTMRSDHQAVHGAIVGLTKFDPTYGFAIMSHIRAFKAEEIMPPLGVRTHDWLKTLK
ncbi:MAG: branched-chain amino acid ABC transporter substrate-binding protein [Bacillati bacterium ANGP1]|uniref:Branched-chain amino acid ABC transporter substrate-binding protein n=1 Tax=Candidatus Segetimicrobium genomatis TaxID=2569760 RepID=A0A537LJY2_9BACT|nr:MAG: branched-chain amino acid ABC transporter substrate-binding protein [Terrabacteria group bacterium ANGP1]